MKARGLVLCLVLSVFIFTGCKESPKKDLKKLIDNHVSAMNTQDVTEAMNAIHKESPFYEQMYKMLESINDVYQLKTELAYFEYIGAYKEDYSIAVIKQKTTKEDGPNFRDNVVETMSIFKKADGEWKIWQTITIGVKYLDEEESVG